MLAHGITATRRYVVHGSLALARDRHRQITYDARGHGESTPRRRGAATRTPSSLRTWGRVIDERGREAGRGSSATRWAPTRSSPTHCAIPSASPAWS